MIECSTLAQALAVPNVVRIQLGAPVLAYQAGDQLPQTTPAPTAPQEVTMRQARLALLGSGKLAAVDAAINSMPDPQKSQARIEWEYSGTVQRNKPLVLSLGPALGLTDADLDNLFTVAATL